MRTKEHLSRLISWSNRKVPHPIFNMNSSDDCPSAERGLCELSDICYAKKAERLYPQVSPYRKRQEHYWDNCLATQFVREFLEACDARKAEPAYLRFSESGDFKSQDDYDKLNAIATMLSWHDIRVYVYTARRDLDFSDRSWNLTITGSNFMADNRFMVTDDPDELVWRINNMPNEPKAVKCVADCYVCTMCAQTKGRIIVAKKH